MPWTMILLLVSKLYGQFYLYTKSAVIGTPDPDRLWTADLEQVSRKQGIKPPTGREIVALVCRLHFLDNNQSSRDAWFLMISSGQSPDPFLAITAIC